jgi:hypothetical protein
VPCVPVGVPSPLAVGTVGSSCVRSPSGCRGSYVGADSMSASCSSTFSGIAGAFARFVVSAGGRPATLRLTWSLLPTARCNAMRSPGGRSLQSDRIIRSASLRLHITKMIACTRGNLNNVIQIFAQLRTSPCRKTEIRHGAAPRWPHTSDPTTDQERQRPGDHDPGPRRRDRRLRRLPLAEARRPLQPHAGRRPRGRSVSRPRICPATASVRPVSWPSRSRVRPYPMIWE